VYDREIKEKKIVFSEFLDDKVSRRDRWSDIKRKYSHRSAFTDLGEDAAKKVWNSWKDKEKDGKRSKRERNGNHDEDAARSLKEQKIEEKEEGEI
jgi:hypothetical protein